jgi:predicted MPP superfamily phosphohydrolase
MNLLSKTRKAIGWGLVIIGLLAFLDICFVEPRWIEITTRTVQIPGVQGRLRAVQLSDFHVDGAVGLEFIEKAVDRALAENPDVVFLTGDFITWQLRDADEYRRILSKLSSRAPAFACIGNHDGGRWAGSSRGYPDHAKVGRLLAASGIRLLFNERIKVRIGKRDILLAGLGDLWSGDLEPEAALETVRGEKLPVIVLAHNPDSVERLDGYDWDLVLSGHTHGGQLVIPLLGFRPFLPVKNGLWAEGLQKRGERQVHITRGVGNLHGLRFNCRPEISVLEISGKCNYLGGKGSGFGVQSGRGMAGIPAMPMVCSNEKRSSIFVASFVDGTLCTAIAFDKARDKARDKVSQIRPDFTARAVARLGCGYLVEQRRANHQVFPEPRTLNPDT